MLFGAFNYSMIPEREEGGGVFGGSLPSVAALLVCMPTDREGEHATFNSRGLDEGGGGGRYRRLPTVSRGAFLCIPTGLEDERAVPFFLRLRLFNFPGAGGGEWGFRWFSAFSGGAFGIHASGSRALARGTCLLLSFRRSIFLERGRGVRLSAAL